MDRCNFTNSWQATALLTLLAGALTAESSHAQQPQRLVYNPITQRQEPDIRQRRQVRKDAAARVRKREIKQVEPQGAVELAAYSEPCMCDDGCCDPYYGCDSVGCGDSVSCCPSPVRACLYAGFEAVLVKPRFEDNVAFTVMQSDGASFESFSDTQFKYDLEFTPRAYVGWQNNDGIGLRATWWLFDHAAATASASPPANGFGSITPPPFGDVDISTVVPTDTLSATTSLQTYTIDIEATRESNFRGWNLGVAGGIRYAFNEQTYLAQTTDDADVLRGQIDFKHSTEGFGPTISLNAYRPIASDAGFFTKARGSVLFGNSEGHMTAGEDLDLTTPFTTTQVTGRDDLLSIGEIQVGFQWQCLSGRVYRPFLSVAMEGQVWNGVGNASSEDGNMGFFGFNSGAGFAW